MKLQTLVRVKASNHFLFVFSLYIYFHNSHVEIDFDIADVGEILTADDNLGDLQLGRVREEYILDPDLRGILSCTVLDADKMIVYEDRELFLTTSVVYSENVEVVRKRIQEVCNLSPPLLWMFVSIFISSDSSQLNWMASSRVSGKSAFYQFFSFPLVFSRKQVLVSNHHCSS